LAIEKGLENAHLEPQ